MASACVTETGLLRQCSFLSLHTALDAFMGLEHQYQASTPMTRPWPLDPDFVVHATGNRTSLLASYPATIEPRSYGIIHHRLSVSRERQATESPIDQRTIDDTAQ